LVYTANSMLIPENKVELRGKRTLNSKHYDNGDGTIIGQFGIGVQHYDNRFGLGDGVTGWRGLEWTLLPNENGWYFEFNSFRPGVPRFADEWLSFQDVFGTKNQTVRFKAVASHVEGRLVASADLAAEGLDKLTNANAVIYDDAFGTGKDLIVYFTRSQMLKCARIRNASKAVQDYTFDWQLELPEGVEVWRKDAAGEYQLDLTRSKDFDTAKTTELRTAAGTTFFKPFRVWDSGEGMERHEAVCTVSYIRNEDGTMVMRKHIPAAFMEASVGDVFCDTTTSYYAGSGCGAIARGWNIETWANAKSGAGQYRASTAYMAAGGGRYNSGGTQFNITRGTIPVPISTLPSGATITSGSVFAWYYANSVGYRTTANSEPAITYLTKSVMADPATCAYSDYANNNNVGSCSNTTVQYDASYGMKEFALNATGLAQIVPGAAYAMFGIQDTADVNNVSVANPSVATGGSDETTKWYSSEYAGTDHDPYLSVTYTVPGGDTTASPSGGISSTAGGAGTY
jgi:hypothetical protein